MKFKRYTAFVYTKSVLILLTITCLVFTFNSNTKASYIDADEPKKDKIIYLTFDDGPSVVTDKILDILKEYNIKATFFFIGNQIRDQKAVVKRTYDEGHSIGLHSYTHNYKYIYSSNQNFLKEMNQCQNEIYDVTGIRPKIIRFPYGSRKRLKESLSNMLHDSNLKVYDWNAYMSDGINYKTSVSKLYSEATKTTVSQYPIILLMHCDYMHKNTCIALPMVIKYYKDQNYEFRVITEDTPEYIMP